MNEVVPVLKDRAILFGWIAGLVLAGSLLWSLTFTYRSVCLMRMVNKNLVLMNDERVLSAPIRQPYTGKFPLGCWYTLTDSDSVFFVFVIMREGILIPCGAEITKDGKMRELAPLGLHARQMMLRLPDGLIQVYARRIETAAAKGGI